MLVDLDDPGEADVRERRAVHRVEGEHATVHLVERGHDDLVAQVERA